MKLPLLKRRWCGNVNGAAPPISTLVFDYPTSFEITQGETYDLSDYASGGVPPYEYSVTGGSLTGTGVTLNTSTGVLTAAADATTAETTGLEFSIEDAATTTAAGPTTAMTVAASPTPAEVPATPEPTSTLRYVSLTGNNANNGLTEGTAWRTMAYAAANTPAGATCYIKAGNYGDDTLFPSNSGTSLSACTQFIGYVSTPGDAAAQDTDNVSDTINTANYPTLNHGDRSTDIAIGFSGKQFLVIKNIQAQNFQQGVYAFNAQDVFVDNCKFRQLGDTTNEYDGYGISVSECDRIYIKKCIVGNSAAEGIMIFSDDCHVTDSLAWSNDNSNGANSSMDYYFHVGQNSHNNVFRRNKAIRVGALADGGHGFGMKSGEYTPGTSTGNWFEDNETVNIEGEAFYCKHRGASGNTFINNLARDSADGWAYVCSNGAHDNTFVGNTATNMGNGIVFYDTIEDDGQHSGGDNNTFTDTTINDAGYAIAFKDYTYSETSSTGNVIDGLVVNGATNLFQVGHFCVDLEVNNAELHDIPNYASYQNTKDSDDLDVTFGGSNSLDNCGFTLP